jgi:hypothetical protein
MGFPVRVGIMVHLTDGIAVRPEVNFRHASTENALGDDETSSTSVSFGVTGIFYVGEWDKLRTYVSPRYAYSHASASSDDTNFESTGSSHTIGGHFGAQYALDQRFGVFGEVGLEYGTAESTIEFLNSTRESSSFGLHSAVGVVFYFK